MTRLIVYPDTRPDQVLLDTTDIDVIAPRLAAAGVTIERWSASLPLAAEADAADVLAAYAPEIERLKRERGYATADVIRVTPGNPNWPAMRQKFLSEHTHEEDEVRFFVEGAGAFYLHIGEDVLCVIGETDDLLSVPAGTRHWFDAGLDAAFTVIRIFSSEEGWVAHYTGDQLAAGFPAFGKEPA